MFFTLDSLSILRPIAIVRYNLYLCFWFLRKMFLIPAVQFSKYVRNLSIPENDTVKEELTVIRPLSSRGLSSEIVSPAPPWAIPSVSSGLDARIIDLLRKS